jgi:dTDP-glucose 4,6-dehydratase
MKTYLVTGGAGFIGSNYVLKLLREKEDVQVINVDKLTYAGNLGNLKDILGDERHIFVQADICDDVAMSALFEQYQPDYVVNFAAESHVDRSIEDPKVFANTNIIGTLCLLQCAKKLWQSKTSAWADGETSDYRFLQVSTDEVYGSLGAEGFFMETTPLDPHSPYSASKAAADMLVKAFYDTYGMPTLITRCSNNYGPYQFPEKLIPLMLNNAINHIQLPVYGDGMQIRDWLYVEDHCTAINLVLEAGRPGQVYNIGGHNEKANIQIVEAIIKYVHDNLDDSVDNSLIKHVTDRLGHDRRYGIDPTKISDELGWEPTVMFEDGIKLTLDWYLNNGEWLKEVTSGAYQNYYQNMYGKR